MARQRRVVLSSLTIPPSGGGEADRVVRNEFELGVHLR